MYEGSSGGQDKASPAEMCLLLGGQIPLLLPKSHSVAPYVTVLYGLANSGVLILVYFPSICSKEPF